MFFPFSTSNWRCTEPLWDYLEKRNIMGICKLYLISAWMQLHFKFSTPVKSISTIITNVDPTFWILTFCLFLLLSCYGTDDVDTRAITRRLRQDGSLVGVLSTEESRSDEELLGLSRAWDIVGEFKIMLLGSIECISCYIFSLEMFLVATTEC